MDLDTPEARGKSGDDRFMERVLTSNEQKSVRGSAHPNRLLWAFWAAKETAYKAVNKLHPDVSSAPGRYEVQLEGEGESAPGVHAISGVVYTPRGPVPVRVMFAPDYVHCIGGYSRSGNQDGIECGMEWGVGAIDTYPESDCNKSLSERESYAARFLAASKIAGILHCHPQDIVITRQNHQSKSGLPKVYVKGKPAGLDISLSHDGRFAAFAVAGLRIL
ncbi:MAG: 4'-phosphopantetheinyl transferase superfamily protein [Desulfosalsimonadaceae bacterium]|nr:4'-phosphopantetheinyl transferase superfamily protein [Desulfosalsimonadaceae bacterium]